MRSSAGYQVRLGRFADAYRTPRSTLHTSTRRTVSNGCRMVAERFAKRFAERFPYGCRKWQLPSSHDSRARSATAGGCSRSASNATRSLDYQLKGCPKLVHLDTDNGKEDRTLLHISPVTRLVRSIIGRSNKLLFTGITG